MGERDGETVLGLCVDTILLSHMQYMYSAVLHAMVILLMADDPEKKEPPAIPNTVDEDVDQSEQSGPLTYRPSGEQPVQ